MTFDVSHAGHPGRWQLARVIAKRLYGNRRWGGREYGEALYKAFHFENQDALRALLDLGRDDLLRDLLQA